MSNPQANARSRMLSRFRKGQASVPGTYMSAAGIQSELSPNCLHKVAVHEATYRKHVRVYRQHLQQQVDVLKKSQNLLRKSLHNYREKRRELAAKRYHPPSSSESEGRDSPFRDVTKPRRQMLIYVDEDGQSSKPVLLVRKPGKKRSKMANSDIEDIEKEDHLILDTPNEHSSDSGIGLDLDAIHNSTGSDDSVYFDQLTVRSSHELDTHHNDLEQDLEPLDRSESLDAGLDQVGKTCHMIITPHEKEPVKSKEEPHTKPRLRKKGTGIKPTKKVLVSQSYDEMHSSHKAQHQNSSCDSRSATNPVPPLDIDHEATEASELSPHLATNREIVDNWVLANTPRQKRNHTDSSEQSFMRLVRMKQSMSMSKHMNVIDKLISGSRNKRLVYLRRISEVSDLPLNLDSKEFMEALEDIEATSEEASTSRPSIDHTDAACDPLSPILVSPRKNVKLPPLEVNSEHSKDTSSNASNPLEEKIKRAMRKVSVSALEAPPAASLQVPPLYGSQTARTQSGDFAGTEAEEETQVTQGVSKAKQPAKGTITARAQEVKLPSEEPANKNVERFIRNETKRMSTVARDVTWQESLAKLRDVHYVFPSKLVEDKGFL